MENRWQASRTGLYGVLLWILAGVGATGCASTVLYDQLFAPSDLPIKYPFGIKYPLGDCEELLKGLSQLNPEKEMDRNGICWVRIRVKRKQQKPTDPKSFRVGWFGEESYDYNKQRLIREYDWSGTPYHGKLEDQINALGIKPEKPAGIMGGWCGLEGFGFLYQRHIIVVHEGNITAVLRNDRPCVVTDFDELERTIHKAFSRGDAAMLRRYRQVLADARVTPEGAKLVALAAHMESVLKRLEGGSLPPVPEAMDAWRRLLSEFKDPEAVHHARDTLLLTLLAAAKNSSNLKRTVLLRDLAWQLGFDHRERDPFDPDGWIFSNQNRQRQLEGIPGRWKEIPQIVAGRVKVDWKSALRWYRDEVEQHDTKPGSFVRTGPALIAQLQRSHTAQLSEDHGDLQGEMALIKARSEFYLSIEAEVRLLSPAGAFLHEQAKALAALPLSKIEPGKVADTVGLLHLWKTPPSTLIEKVKQFDFDLFRPITIRDDPLMQEALLAAAATAEAAGRLGTAAGMYHLASYSVKTQSWSEALLTKKGKDVDLQRIAAKMALELVPRPHPQDPRFSALTGISDLAPLFYKAKLRMSESFTKAPGPTFRLTAGEPTCEIKVRYSNSTDTKEYYEKIHFKGNEHEEARQKLQDLNQAIAELDVNIAGLKSVATTSNGRSYVGSVTGTSERNRADGVNSTEYEWQGYSTNRQTTNKVIVRRIQELLRHRGSLWTKRNRLIASNPQDRIHVRLKKQTAPVPVMVQKWTGDCRRPVQLDCQGMQTKFVQVSEVYRELRQRDATDGLPAYNDHTTEVAVKNKLLGDMDRKLQSRKNLPMQLRVFINNLIDQRVANLSQAHAWTSQEAARERAWLHTWLTKLEDQESNLIPIIF